jgi:predicted P-loop ATPase
VNTSISAIDKLEVSPDSFGASKIEKLKTILRENFKLRRNKITGRYEYALKNQTDFYELNDRVFNSILSRISSDYIPNLSDSHLRMIIESDFTPDYCPIVEYFNILEPWDMETDHIKYLANLIKVKEAQFTNDNEGKKINAQSVWETYLKRWLVATTATMLQLSVNHSCLTLLGPQGIGKTTFLRKLGISEDLVYIGAINPNDKDSKIYYAEKTIIVLDELEATTKYELAQLKSNMTLSNITVRRPYARRPEVLPRRASFCASANDIHVLSDLTGSRRWLCVEVETIDYKGITPELMKLVYAQALYLLNTGFKHWFDNEEIISLENNNTRFYQPLPEEEALLKIVYHPEKQPISFIPDILTNTELIGKMSSKFPGVKFSSKKLGQVLAKYNFNRKSRSEDRLYGYEVILRNENS